MWLYKANECAFDEEYGKYTYEIDSLSTESLIDDWPYLNSLVGQYSRPPEFQYSHCFGSLDWAWLLIPDPKSHHTNYADEIKKKEYIMHQYEIDNWLTWTITDMIQ